MAKNILGELENAPGAAQREAAFIKRELATSERRLADSYYKVACSHFHNRGVHDARGDIAWKLPREMLSQSASSHWQLARESARQGNEAYGEYEKYKELASKHKWEARGHSVKAFFQTWGARLGFSPK